MGGGGMHGMTEPRPKVRALPALWLGATAAPRNGHERRL